MKENGDFEQLTAGRVEQDLMALNRGFFTLKATLLSTKDLVQTGGRKASHRRGCKKC